MQRRLVLGISASAIVLLVFALAAVAFRADAGAQDGDTEGHALVGAWVVDTDLEDDTDPPEIFSFSADGTFVQVDGDGDPLIGAWEATGDYTGVVTIITVETDDDGAFAAGVIIRAAAEVSASERSFTAEYTFEVVDPAGNSTGEAGPGTVEGQRLEVQAPGEPVMTIDELFESLGGEDDTAD
jgi:hypothetical protein